MLEKAKPAEVSGGQRGFYVSNWKAPEKNTLRGFFSLTLPSGIVIHNCTLHQRKQSQSIGLPARPYKTVDGNSAYTSLIEFATTDKRSIPDAAVSAISRFLEGNQ